MDVTGVVNSVGTTCAQTLVDKARKELHYLCSYESYADDFKMEKQRLSATMESVDIKREEAKKRNETETEPVVQRWLKDADGIIHNDIKPKKWFGFCTNCFSQIAQAKELEKMTQKTIPDLISEAQNFPQVARAAGAPGMEFLSQEFMHFESRKAKLDELEKELKNEKNCMIGLQGMGGTGKSTMAIEVGKQVEKSKLFDEVIFISVSNPANEKNIRDDIAKQLELQLEEEKVLTHAEQIWIRIANAGRVLIILDDVWEELNRENIGIQLGIHSKGRCCILLTTRYGNVCTRMQCQKTIQLEVLPEKDALNLFLYHASANGGDCPHDLKKVALDIVNECGRLPVIVVAVAKTLRNWPSKEWQAALTTLKNAESLRNEIDDENMRKFYNSLELSYTNLKNEEVQKLFMVCSIFPKAYEIPIELLSRIAIGLGLFGEVDSYYEARSKVPAIKNKLINSSLLLNVGEECVKMHDMIREVALDIAEKQFQVIMDSGTNLKQNIKYSSWIINDFSNCFDGSKLEVLLVWINGDHYLEVPDAFFRSMMRLKVLLLHCEFSRTSASSLAKSIQSLINIQTLSLTNWVLGDISILGKLQKLHTLELTNCSITELPDEVSELRKLRLLGLTSCSIETKNPFEVIKRCSQLEELYYVSNDDIFDNTKLPQITTLPNFRRYHIMGQSSSTPSFPLDVSTEGYFKPGKLTGIFSEELVKFLVARAEILELDEDNEIEWMNLIPDMAPLKDDAMEGLVRLCLKSWSKIKCLINTEHLPPGVAILSKLVELQLDQMNLTALCCGLYPVDFLKQLEKLHLKQCLELKGTLFEGELELGNLKSIELDSCSVTYLYHPSTAQNLKQLETLSIQNCAMLKYIIRDEGSLEEKMDYHNPNQKSPHSMFSKLKSLKVEGCGELEFILPICFCDDIPLLENVDIFRCQKLEYIFGQYPEQEGLHQMGKEIILSSLKEMCVNGVPKFISIYPKYYLPLTSKLLKSSSTTSEGSKLRDESHSHNFSWGPLCCFLPKSSAINEDAPSGSKATQPDHIASQALEDNYISNTAHGFFIPPLYPSNLREIMITEASNLASLFTLSVASSMLLLEKLEVGMCDALEHIVTKEGDNHDNMTWGSIFPNLRKVKVWNCGLLDYIFPASYSRNFVHLESIEILEARKLQYVFGECHFDNNLPPQHLEVQVVLPALKSLCLQQVPKIINICIENYYVTALSLEDICLEECLELPIKPFIDSSVGGRKRQEDLSRRKEIQIHLRNLKRVSFKSLNSNTIYDLKSHQSASLVNSNLENLSLRGLPELRHICMGPKNKYLSFQYLSKLKIEGCRQLRVILSASVLKSLPKLGVLVVSECEEVECIIKDEENEQICFPKLRRIIVRQCKSLKYLFSISTCGVLPELLELKIKEAPELEQVFKWEQGATQELVEEHVLPKLLLVELINLQNLHSVCKGINLQTVTVRLVRGCPNISLTSSTNSAMFEFLAPVISQCLGNSGDDDFNIEELFKLFNKHVRRMQALVEAFETVIPQQIESPQSEEEALQEDTRKDSAISEQNNGSPNLENSEEEASEEVIEKDSAISKQNNGSPNLENCEEASKEVVEKDSTAHKLNTGLRNLIEIKKTAGENVKESSKSEETIGADEVKDSKRSNTPAPISSPLLIESPHNIERCFGEGSSSEKYKIACSPPYLEPEISHQGHLTSNMESMGDFGKALGEGICSEEATDQRIDKTLDMAQKVRKHADDCSSEETSDRIALAIYITEYSF